MGPKVSVSVRVGFFAGMRGVPWGLRIADSRNSTKAGQ
jgi:hypothetical protein